MEDDSTIYILYVSSDLKFSMIYSPIEEQGGGLGA
jgi:hypothetical protein